MHRPGALSPGAGAVAGDGLGTAAKREVVQEEGVQLALQEHLLSAGNSGGAIATAIHQAEASGRRGESVLDAC